MADLVAALLMTTLWLTSEIPFFPSIYNTVLKISTGRIVKVINEKTIILPRLDLKLMIPFLGNNS
ncbi:MAG TPA: hypothetical protein PLS41_08370, partial [Bacteroidales bacterium]|nr:hypothetical protein [Bacteroidales bacterium]